MSCNRAREAFLFVRESLANDYKLPLLLLLLPMLLLLEPFSTATTAREDVDRSRERERELLLESAFACGFLNKCNTIYF